ncbi:MAG: DUF2029 domain-containing protein [Chloroflexi bacterium]|nr:DUF2029 domain-containing protein [Chloroflexota bacterium]
MGTRWALPVLLGAVYLLVAHLPMGADWHYHFCPFSRALLFDSAKLYDSAGSWYNPPWLLPLLVPFVLLPEAQGLLAYRLVELVVVGYAAATFGCRSGAKLWPFVLVMGSLPVWDSLVTGNVDIWALLGLTVLAQAARRQNPYLFGAGLALALLKPQESLIAVVAVLPAVRSWHRNVIIRALGMLAGIGGLSALLAGYDWLPRMVRMIQDLPPASHYSIALWSLLRDMAGLMGWPAGVVVLEAVLWAGVLVCCWRRPDVYERLALGVAAGPVVMPHVPSPGLVLPMVLAWPRLIEQGRYVAAGVTYGMQALYLLRFFFPWETHRLLTLFPVVLVIMLLLTNDRGASRAFTTPSSSPEAKSDDSSEKAPLARSNETRSSRRG